MYFWRSDVSDFLFIMHLSYNLHSFNPFLQEYVYRQNPENFRPYSANSWKKQSAVIINPVQSIYWHIFFSQLLGSPLPHIFLIDLVDLSNHIAMRRMCGTIQYSWSFFKIYFLWVGDKRLKGYCNPNKTAFNSRPPRQWLGYTINVQDRLSRL